MTTTTPIKQIDHSQPHLVIRASAGAGKTFQLSTRYLRLILQGREPGKILATTFTRKAAGEVLGRVLSRLADGVVDDLAAKKLAGELQMPHLTRSDLERALESLARNLHRLSVCTIDSFFNRLCQTFRHELKLPHPIRLTTGESALGRELKLLSVQAVLEDQDPAVLLDLLQRLHHDSNIRSVTDSILSIVDDLHTIYLDAPGATAWDQIPLSSAPDPKDIADAIAMARDAGLAAGVKGVETALKYAEAGNWVKFFETALTSGVSQSIGPIDRPIASPQIPVFNRKPITPELFEAMKLLVRVARITLLARIANRTRASHSLLEKFDEQFARLRDEHRVLLFSDLTYKLTRHIGALDAAQLEDELNDIFFRIDGRIDHILFDEFQDTSVQQWRILQPLSHEVTSHGSATSVNDGAHERTFFCVGDIKQAIYSWRGGCAEIFDHVESALTLGANALAGLSHSHRSSPIVLEVVNKLFARLPEAPALIREKGSDDSLRGFVTDWTKGFPPHTTHKNLTGFVELRTTDVVAEDANSDESGGDAQVEHLKQSAAYIAGLVAAHPGKSIGVLTRRGDPAASLIDLLRRLQVDASGEGGATITHDPAVNAVLSAMTMADHPGERADERRAAAVFHVMNSPLAQVLPTVLGLRDIGNVDAIASRLRRSLVDHGYARVVSDLAIGLASAGVCDHNNLVHLGQLVELADAFEPDSTLRPHAFVDFVVRSEVETTSRAAVRVMTIHKAKGLEFDVVVLPDLDSAIFGKHAAALTLRNSPTDPIDAVFVGANKTAASFFTPLANAYELHERQIMRETACVMYVAMTRARQALHMLIKPLVQPNGKPARATLSMASLIRQSLVTTDPPPTDGVLFAHGDPNWDLRSSLQNQASTAPAPVAAPLPTWSNLPRAKSSIRSLPTASPSSLESEGRVSVGDLLQPATGGARLRGTAIHGWFSLIEYLDTDAYPITREQMLAMLSREVPDAPPAQIESWMEKFREMLARPAVRAALARPKSASGHTSELWRERAFVVEMKGRILRGIFDRVLITRDMSGKAVAAELLDYKTDSVEIETISQTTHMYKPQVRAYVGALISMLGLPRAAVTSRLLFVGAGLSIEMDDEAEPE